MYNLTDKLNLALLNASTFIHNNQQGGGGNGDGPHSIGDIFGNSAFGEVMTAAGPVIRILFWGFIAIMAIFFAFKLIVNFLNFFKADDEREKTEAKKKAIANAIGLVICIVAGPIANFALHNLAGISPDQFSF